MWYPRRTMITGIVTGLLLAAFWGVSAPAEEEPEALDLEVDVPELVDPAAELINVNTATQVELERIAGVGPVLAARIIEHRPYEEIDDLLEVPGIGEVSLEGMRDQIEIGEEEENDNDD